MAAPPLRILHVIHDFLPRHRAGSEIYADTLCRALAARGHFPVVLCADVDPARVHGRIVWRDWRGLTVAEIANNWAFDSFDESWASPRLDAQIAGVLDATQPHVVHVHNLLNLSLRLPEIARRRGIPVLATLHDYTLVCPSGGQRIHLAEDHVCHTIEAGRCARCFSESPFQAQLALGRFARRRVTAKLLGRVAARVRRHAPALGGPLLQTARRLPAPSITPGSIERRLIAARRVFSDVDLFVAPSRHLAEEFLSLGVPAAKMVVSDYGFPPLPRPVRPDGRPQVLRIGYVGTLVRHKGVHLLIDAMKRLSGRRAELHIFGDEAVFPSYAAELRAQARGLPITFEGAFDRERVSEIYGRFDVLAVPSLWLENSPLVIHEAFMCGVPVIGARIGGIADLVADGVNGLLVEPGSSEAFVAAFGRLLDDGALFDRLRASHTPVKSIDDDAREWEERYVQAGRVGASRAEAAS